MKHRIWIVLVLALGGCASTVQARPATALEAVAPADLASERDAARALEERVRELSAALGLARAEARELREELNELRTAERTRVTRIGQERQRPSEEDPAVDVVAPATTARPVLRLYGTASTPSGPIVPIPGPVAPPIVEAPPLPSMRLPVLADSDGVPAIPLSPVTVAPPLAPRLSAEVAPTPRRPADDPAARAYRAALTHVAERRLDEALAGLDAFLRDHPQHAYADNARYWRGEIHYTRRDYRRALAELTALVERHPRGNKVPEALLRIGLCHERMGDRQRARQVFERLRTQFPDSVAARMAPREDV